MKNEIIKIINLIINKIIKTTLNFPLTDEEILKLPKEKYPNYLKRKYFFELKEVLNLKNPKHVGEQIQWLKLYDNTPIKTQLTDKILVRDWIKEKIGEEYLKPIYWIGDNFDDIPFDTLPNDFYIKTNHGCKWHMYIKDKNKFLTEKPLYNYTKNKFETWLKKRFGIQNLELQYLNIEPKLFIEENVNKNKENGNIDIEIWCFNKTVKFTRIAKYHSNPDHNQVIIYDENLNIIKLQTNNQNMSEDFTISNELKKAIELSKQLSKNFKLVRVDWFLSNRKLYFNEMTFTPCAGFFTKEMSVIKKEKIML